MRWPSAWTDPALLDILKGTPVNCLLNAPSNVADAAKARGLMAVSRDEAAKSVQFLADPQWPGVRPRKSSGDGADAGPTGAPWVDSNAWAIQLARALDPSRPVWVEAVPEQGTIQNDAAYQLAAAEPRAFGAQWVVSLDEASAKRLAEGDSGLKTRWGRMMDTTRFFVGRPVAAADTVATLAVISDFAGDNEFLGKEFLNMAARRNLLYYVAPKRAALTLPSRIATAVLVDEQKPDAALTAALEKFVRNGGLLIASIGSGAATWGSAAGPAGVPGYTMRALGKGKIAIPQTAWSDPFVMAAEVRILVGRRTDVIRIFNEGMIGVAYAPAPGGGLIHLINYSRWRSSEQVTIATAETYAKAQATSLEHPSPQEIKVTPRPQRFCEIPIPAFAVYSAIDLRRS